MNYRNTIAGFLIFALALFLAPSSEARHRGQCWDGFGVAQANAYGGYGGYNGYGYQAGLFAGGTPYHESGYGYAPYGAALGAAYDPYGYQDYRRRQRRNRTRNIVLGVAAVAVLSQLLK